MISSAFAESRTQSSLLFHYIVERDLASQLRRAWAEERLGLYRTVYNELFRRIPDHPQQIRKGDPVAQAESTRDQLTFLRYFLKPDTVYLEIGCGDAHLSLSVAPQVRQAYAVEVSELVADQNTSRENFQLLMSDGIAIDVPRGTVTFAYSHQVIEHLHPEDATRQLQHVVNAMAPGGTYACVTPHLFSGPHDISGYFAEEAGGFHLKEYTYRELRRLLRGAGFESVQFWIGAKGQFFRLPSLLVLAFEAAIGRLPRHLRRAAAKTRALTPIFGNIFMVGRKPK